MPSAAGRQLAHRFVAARWYLFAVAVILTLAGLLPATRLSFDRSIENMFSENDPVLPPYRELKRTFGGNEIVMAVYRDPELSEDEGSARLDQLTERLRSLPGVASVLSLKTLPGMVLSLPSVPGIERIPGSDRLRAFRDLFQGYTHGADGQTAAVVCMLQAEEALENRGQTLEQIREAVAVYPSGTIIGEPVMVEEGFGLLEEDGQRLTLWSTLLLSITILLCFRSIRWMLIPLAVVQFTLVLTRGLLAVSGFRLSMVSSMLTAVVTVVAVATVVHIIVHFREARTAGLSPTDALVRTTLLLSAPITLACLTDAVGFSALLTATVGPVQDFGAMAALGCVMVIPAVALVVPALATVGRFDTDPQRAWGEGGLDGLLRASLQMVERHRSAVFVLLVVTVAVAISGSIQLRVETDFTKNFRRSSRIVTAYEFVEEHLGGAGVWDVVLPAPAKLEKEYLGRVLKLETRLREEVPQLSKVLSLADAIELIPLPVGGAQAVMRGTMPIFYDALYHADPENPQTYSLRIMLRSPERLPADEKEALIQDVQQIVAQEFPEAKTTGYYVLLARLIQSVLRDQWVTLSVATAGIWLMMTAALRSVRLATIALAPNAVAVLLVFGTLGWLGVSINLGAAMIAAVSLGLAIDASIHYLTVFQRACRGGSDTRGALKIAHHSVGRALCFSTLALIVGFTSLCQSQFVPTIYFGALVSAAMLGGLFGNLVVLPLLLLGFSRKSG